MYCEGSGKVVGCAQRHDRQACLLGCILIDELIHDLIDCAIPSRSNKDVIVCMAKARMTVWQAVCMLCGSRQRVVCSMP